MSGLSIIRQALFLVYIQVILQLPYHIVAKSVPLAHTGLGLAVFTITSAYPMPPDTSHVSLLKSHLYMHRHTKRFPFPCLRTRLLSIHFDKFLIYFFNVFCLDSSIIWINPAADIKSLPIQIFHLPNCDTSGVTISFLLF